MRPKNLSSELIFISKVLGHVVPTLNENVYLGSAHIWFDNTSFKLTSFQAQNTTSFCLSMSSYKRGL